MPSEISGRQHPDASGGRQHQVLLFGPAAATWPATTLPGRTITGDHTRRPAATDVPAPPPGAAARSTPRIQAPTVELLLWAGQSSSVRTICAC